MNPASFFIDRDEGRMPVGDLPEGPAQAKNLCRFTAVVTEKNESTERILFDGCLLFTGERFALKTHDKHLTDLFFECCHAA
jgi:hypothetical protein